jgi:hypothetical protein
LLFGLTTAFFVRQDPDGLVARGTSQGTFAIQFRISMMLARSVRRWINALQ